jgi:hypothetical protein
MRSYPEAKLALMIAIDRLNELTSAKSMTVSQPQPNQSGGLNPQDLNALMESLMKTMNCDE